ncbi:hypothetical protein [Filimonas effusa]|uniref:Uncharacterized protein n=1 Tax=Filimonas effusa TaxID=2508721 RepID=A0A4Q1D5P6_9BACT|nr:hypothetical protein [Filimonas effusa]RXK83296.1 hypothetical protein ESB13_14395 [Filimonas effusa]
MLRVILFLLICVSGASELRAQLTPLFKAEGVYSDSTDCGGLIVPRLNVRVDSKDRLFYKDSLVFTPTGKFGFSIYELVSGNYIVVSAIDSSLLESSAIYLFAKKGCLDLQSW